MLKKINISILGMGYVGLPLAVEAGKYFPTIGFDINKFKIDKLKKNIDQNNLIKKTDIKKVDYWNLSNIDDLSNITLYNMCSHSSVKQKTQFRST